MCGRCSICRRRLLRKVSPSEPAADYDHAFEFWRLLAESYTPFGNSKALVNTEAPFILSNALWYPEPGSITELRDFYNEQGVSASCVLSALLDDGLFQTLALSNAGFSRTAQYTFSPVSAANPTELAVEQVSWTQARTLGEVIAEVYALSPYAVAVGQSLALAMQLENDLAAFVAYGGPAVGAMVTLETPEKLVAFVLESLTEGADSALRTRLLFEAETRGKGAFVFEQTQTGGLELWR
jgi:hypothetical protein